MGNEVFAKRISDLRKARNWTLEELGKKVDMGKTTVLNWEKTGSVPNEEILRKLSKEFEVSVDYLLGNDNMMENSNNILFRNWGKLSEEDKEDLAEKARRDYGILMYAKRLNAAELVSMYTDMRYAAAEKLTDIPVETLDEMLIRSLPNTIVCENEGVCTPSERDLKRAETVRSIIGQSNG